MGHEWHAYSMHFIFERKVFWFQILLSTQAHFDLTFAKFVEARLSHIS